MVQSAERFTNKQRSQIGRPCPGAFIENVDPCLRIFQWKVVPMSRDFLQKTDPKGRNVPVCLNMWVPPRDRLYHANMCTLHEGVQNWQFSRKRIFFPNLVDHFTEECFSVVAWILTSMRIWCPLKLKVRLAHPGSSPRWKGIERKIQEAPKHCAPTYMVRTWASPHSSNVV